MLINKLVVVLLLLLVVLMAQNNAEASKTEATNTEEMKEEPKQEAVGFSVQLHKGEGGKIAGPEAWEKIIKKDKARAQWISDRINKANKEESEKKAEQEEKDT